MARAVWKGTITFGATRLPVKLYTAIEDRRVHFRLLHRRDGVPVKQRMVHPQTKQPVAAGEIYRGLPVDGGAYVIVRDEERKQLLPAASRSIEVDSFVPGNAIGPLWYNRPYYLGPDGDAALYHALAEALKRQSRVAVVRWAMRNQRYVGVLQGGRYLLLTTLRWADEVLPLSELKAPGGSELSAKEIELAQSLTAAFAGEFDPAEYHDQYRQRVEELIDAKVHGKRLKLPRLPTPAKETSVTDALRESLRRVRERKAA